MVDRIRLPRVKVCGLTRRTDVELALARGADALGVVLHPPSPRSVPVEQVQGLLAGVPGEVARVAVLVDTDPEAAARVLDRAPFNWVQLCGQEEPEDWRGFRAPILRRLSVEPGAQAQLAAWEGIATGFVLDHPRSPGGSGEVVDWDLAAELARRGPCLLAGGLHGGNVMAAVQAVLPLGVDAASRLEASPGIKDPVRLSSYVLKSLTALAALAQ